MGDSNALDGHGGGLEESSVEGRVRRLILKGWQDKVKSVVNQEVGKRGGQSSGEGSELQMNTWEPSVLQGSRGAGIESAWDRKYTLKVAGLS